MNQNNNYGFDPVTGQPINQQPQQSNQNLNNINFQQPVQQQINNNFNNQVQQTMNNNYTQQQSSVEPVQQAVQEMPPQQSMQFKSSKNNKTILFIIIAVILLIVIVAGILIFVNENDNQENDNNDNVSNSILEDNVDEDYVAEWNDYTAYVQGVEFTFPMSFEEFENKISQTSYKLNDNYSKDDEIFSSYSTSNYIQYTNEVREYNNRTGKHALQYNINVFLQNLSDTLQPASNCTVIGFEVKNIIWGSSNETDLPYDEDVYFTKSKLYLGQSMTRKELIKKFGPSNGWINDNNKYGAGSTTSAFYKFPKFQCNMDDENKISYISLINYIEEEN